jgi:hypothetical protein
MAINMSEAVYSPCQGAFGRPVIFTSKTGDSYSGTGRGIYGSTEIDVGLEDGSILSDQRTILDIRTDEFTILPAQDDTVQIPAEPITGLPDLGSFQIIDTNNNGGGEITLVLRKIAP